MKTCSLFLGLGAFLAVSIWPSPQVRADSGIAGQAMETKAKASDPVLTNAPTQTAPDKNTLAKPSTPTAVPAKGPATPVTAPATSATPTVSGSTTVTTTEPIPETGIKTGPGTLIEPKVHDPNVNPSATQMHEPQQADYHAQQTAQ